MLHDPGSYAPPRIFETIELEKPDKEVLRELGRQIALIAALPVHNETAILWTRLNDLDSQRPMVWINEIP
jgi:hypothetical protein